MVEISIQVAGREIEPGRNETGLLVELEIDGATVPAG
jgi:hypothetical protein